MAMADDWMSAIGGRPTFALTDHLIGDGTHGVDPDGVIAGRAAMTLRATMTVSRWVMTAAVDAGRGTFSCRTWPQADAAAAEAVCRRTLMDYVDMARKDEGLSLAVYRAGLSLARAPTVWAVPPVQSRRHAAAMDVVISNRKDGVGKTSLDGDSACILACGRRCAWAESR